MTTEKRDEEERAFFTSGKRVSKRDKQTPEDNHSEEKNSIIEEEFSKFVMTEEAAISDEGLKKHFVEYIELARRIKKRKKHVLKFMKHLHQETSFLTAPASSHYHLNIRHGLLIHSINVTRTLLSLKGVLAPKIEDESCIIVGLFHDVGKVGYPGQPYYITDEKGNYTSNPGVRAMAIATRSLFLISRFIPLTPDEAQAIAYHDGLYVPEGVHVKNKECPLLLLTHYSDMWAAHILEYNIPDASDSCFVWWDE